ncbi:UNVERIFIED_CONTAM: PI-PLC X domain-containing protein [Sesamum radiatum]|uniref:PI-PLC X domain-containing protein n=1 Tax=Sesamum radiatum TaxID=300843 RepID=A0AAW2RBQ0_SESRA
MATGRVWYGSETPPGYQISLILTPLGFLPVKLFLIAAFLFSYSSSLKIGETCRISSSDCDAGLTCGTCPANNNTRPRCIRTQPIIPTTKVKGLPFNRYSWLTTHNSFARAGSKSSMGSLILAPTNQDGSVTDQLKNGVRGLMLDMYDFNNEIWLCHSFGGKCYNVTAFQPATVVLREIEVFLEQNPTEIITIFIEDYVASPYGLMKVFNESGLSKFMLPLSQMPKDGKDWPTVARMVKKNHRLVVFTSKSSKQASENIAYLWDYVVENQYGKNGMIAGSCPQRPESSPMNTASKSLLSDGGGAPEAVDRANGGLACGCDSIAYCRVNATFGTCNVPVLAPPPPAQLPPIARVDEHSQSSPMSRPLNPHRLILAILANVLLMWL